MSKPVKGKAITPFDLVKLLKEKADAGEKVVLVTLPSGFGKTIHPPEPEPEKEEE